VGIELGVYYYEAAIQNEADIVSTVKMAYELDIGALAGPLAQNGTCLMYSSINSNLRSFLLMLFCNKVSEKSSEDHRL